MRHILIVTDDQDMGEAMQLVLQTSGHEAEFTPDLPGALDKASTFRPTVALISCDLGGPRGGDPHWDRGRGFEVAQRLREVLGGSVFLVVHSGYHVNDIRERARAVGFDAYLGKPADLEEILALVEQSGRTGPLWEDSQDCR